MSARGRRNWNRARKQRERRRGDASQCPTCGAAMALDMHVRCATCRAKVRAAGLRAGRAERRREQRMWLAYKRQIARDFGFGPPALWQVPRDRRVDPSRRVPPAKRRQMVVHHTAVRQLARDFGFATRRPRQQHRRRAA